MPRAPRIEYAGAIYHIIARGDRRESIVTDDFDRNIFVKTLSEVCESSGWEVFAWVLMNNHYHLALRTPEPNLVAGMHWFQTTFTRRINVRHQLWGHLFGGRYKSVLVEDDTLRGTSVWSSYLRTLIDYIHLNPVRAGLCGGDNSSVADYVWSSLPRDYSLPPSKRRPWMAVSETLELFGLKDNAEGRREFLERLEKQATAEVGENAGVPDSENHPQQSMIRRGWYWGSPEFKEHILDEFGEESEKSESRSLRSSGLVQDNSLAKAERILSEAVEHFAKDVLVRSKASKGDLRKVAVAWAVVRKTRVPQSWVAERLGLWNAANVSQRVRRFAELEESELSEEVRSWKRRFLTPDP